MISFYVIFIEECRKEENYEKNKRKRHNIGCFSNYSNIFNNIIYNYNTIGYTVSDYLIKLNKLE